MRFRFLLNTILFTSLVAAISGCEIINPDEETPSYIRISSIDFDPGTVGANSPKINDAWIYLNGRHIGTFELPAIVPILSAGNQNITVRAGVNSDGIKQLRFPYPFYTDFNQQVNLIPGQVQVLDPVVSYRADLKYPFDINENFQDNSFDLQPHNPIYDLEVSEDPAFQFANSEGKVGLIRSKTDTLEPIIIESSFWGKLPQGGSFIYLEFDYKSSLDIQVGVEVTSNGQVTKVPDLTLFGSREWNKVYVNLIDEVSRVNNPNANFRIYLEARPKGTNQDYVAVDNVRLIHF